MPDKSDFKSEAPGGTGVLIMIVDDDPLITLLMERVLTKEGYSVISASEAPQAIGLYREWQATVRLVILDFKMPGADGFTIFKELRKINPKVSAALTSGCVQECELREMLTQGMRGFIPKPLSHENFLSKVRAILDLAPLP